jgi:hypothetical protein
MRTAAGFYPTYFASSKIMNYQYKYAEKQRKKINGVLRSSPILKAILPADDVLIKSFWFGIKSTIFRQFRTNIPPDCARGKNTRASYSMCVQNDSLAVVVLFDEPAGHTSRRQK